MVPRFGDSSVSVCIRRLLVLGGLAGLVRFEPVRAQTAASPVRADFSTCS
jgi:hypothetical protein